jgi:hypothetical protein
MSFILRSWQCRFLIALAALTAGPLCSWAEHATIDLQVFPVNAEGAQTSKGAKAGADQEPPVGGHNARPLFKVKARQPLVLQFVLINKYPHGIRKDVTVRYFVVREQKPGQKALPTLTKGIVTQGQFTMNFKPKCRVGARVTFQIKKPGTYLVRVDTLNTASDHEHFSAIDLKVE